MAKKECMLLFSGGRDSTISAVYLANRYDYVNLITIKSNHLTGLEKVYLRLIEIEPFLKNKGRWQLFEKPDNIETNSLSNYTCLPCHSYYLALLHKQSVLMNVKNISLGYVGYQNYWEEQSKYAIKSLQKYFKKYDLNLELPVSKIQEKEFIKSELRKYGLSEEALEQKCLKSPFNRSLPVSEIKNQIKVWISNIEKIFLSLNECNIVPVDTKIF